ncbi:MAG: hypothetical protein ACTSRA_03340, partial [Promethearchaeota archaeon]
VRATGFHYSINKRRHVEIYKDLFCVFFVVVYQFYFINTILRSLNNREYPFMLCFILLNLALAVMITSININITIKLFKIQAEEINARKKQGFRSLALFFLVLSMIVGLIIINALLEDYNKILDIITVLLISLSSVLLFSGFIKPSVIR